MEQPRHAPVCLVTRSQALFQAFVVPEVLEIIQPEWIDQLTIPAPLQPGTSVRAWLGRGPISHELSSSATLFFEQSDENYPVFGFPSEGPAGAGVTASKLSRMLVADEHTAIFCLEAASLTPVAPELFDQARSGNLDTSTEAMISSTLAATRSVLDTLVGAYALYQYPLVWTALHERHLYTLVNIETREGTKSFEPHQPDNFVPFKLNPITKLHNGHLSDGVIENSARIVTAGIKDAFIFLKDSMWHSDLRTRFLLQFWIVEYFAEQYSENEARDAETRQFADAIEKVVQQYLPAYVDRFKSRKGDLVRATLVEKVRTCFDRLRIQYNDAEFKIAKRIRDSLSHGSSYEHDELVAMELFIREIARHLIRRDLELKGVFLEGSPQSPSELPLVVPSFIRTAGRRRQASFNLC